MPVQKLKFKYFVQFNKYLNIFDDFVTLRVLQPNLFIEI